MVIMQKSYFILSFFLFFRLNDSLAIKYSTHEISNTLEFFESIRKNVSKELLFNTYVGICEDSSRVPTGNF